MNENPSQTLKEISNDNEVDSPSEIENPKEKITEENLSFEEKDIPSADSSSSRRNNDLDNAGFTQEEFA